MTQQMTPQGWEQGNHLEYSTHILRNTTEYFRLWKEKIKSKVWIEAKGRRETKAFISEEQPLTGGRQDICESVDSRSNRSKLAKT